MNSNSIRFLIALAAGASLSSSAWAVAQEPARAPDRSLPRGTQEGPALPLKILMGMRAATPTTLKGVKGQCHVDLGTATVIPDREALAAFAETVAQSVHGADLVYQVLTGGEAPELASPLPVLPALLDAEACRDLARTFLDRFGAAGVADWTQPRLDGRIQPLFRPDVPGVAYYELGIAPQGWVIVATGRHDHPVASWSHAGEPPTSHLIAQAGTAAAAVARFYKVGDFTYVAENNAGHAVARLGDLPTSPSTVLLPAAPPSWQQFKTECLTRLAERAVNEAGEREAAWAAFDAIRQPHGPLADSWIPIENWTRRASSNSVAYQGSLADQRIYNQYRGPYGCDSGCTPTAWAMLIGWVDLRAHYGDPRWSALTGMFRSGGTIFGSPATVAPRDMNLDVRSLVEFLRAIMGTSCSGSAGVTPTGNTILGGLYTSMQGASAVGAWSSWHIHANTHRDYGIAAIQSGQPALIGRDSHMALAFGYWGNRQFRDGVEISRPVEYFYMNQGWGGVFAWIPAGCYLGMTVTPGVVLENYVERCRCGCTIYFEGSDGYWRAIPRGGASVRIPVINGSARWYCNGTYERTRFDDEARTLEVTVPDVEPTGIIIVSALR
jgi:hypothetical protein